MIYRCRRATSNWCKHLSFIVLLFWTSVTPELTAAADYVPPVSSPLARKIHPRLFLTAEQLPDLRARLQSLYHSDFQKYVHALDTGFGESPASKSENLLLIDAKNYAFLFLLDPQQMPSFQFAYSREQYGRKAIAHAMIAKDMDRGDSHSSAKPHSSEGGYHNLSLAVVYDWAHPLLSLEEKRLLADGMIRLYEARDKDAEPDAKPKLSNKVSGYIHSGAAAALALWGDQLGANYEQSAQEMLNFFEAVFLERTLVSGDRLFQGPAWSEGASYYLLGMTNVSFMAAAASSALGRKLLYETDFLRRNVLYVLYNTLPLKLRDNYYMSRHDTNSLQPVIDPDISRLIAISSGALRVDDPQMAGLARWMLTTGGLGMLPESYKYYSPNTDDLFIKFLWGSKDVVPQSPEQLALPLSAQLGLGEIVIKSSFDLENSTHIIFWAPEYWYAPHAHKDLASFTIYKHGSLALDAGNGKNGADLPRGDSFSEAVFHNILGLYDPAQDDGGYNFMDFDFSPDGGADHWQDPAFSEEGRNRLGRLLGFEANQDFTFADYDYTQTYDASRCSLARRRLLYLNGSVDNEFVIIHDLMRSPQQKRFLLHTAFEPVIGENTVTVENNFDRSHGRMMVHSVLPASKEIVKVGGEGNWFVDADWKVIDSRGPYVDWGAYWTGSYRCEIRSDENEFLTVMHLSDSRNVLPNTAITSIRAANFSGVLIDQRNLVMLANTPDLQNQVEYEITAPREVRHLLAGFPPNEDAVIFREGVRILHKSTGNAGVITFRDNNLGNTAYKVVIGQALSVQSRTHNMLETYRLSQNHPNPFKPMAESAQYGAETTLIEYYLPAPGKVELDIFDVTGRLVRTLAASEFTAGVHKAVWNGLTNQRKPAPAGVYYYRLHAQQFSAIKKLILLR